MAGVLVKHCHSDNGIFISDHFREDCCSKRQTQTFSGVGAKHQNARAERAIQTITYWARKMMAHAAIHWPGDGADDVRLWAFAITHAAWLYNHLPNKNLGWMSPMEILTKSRSGHCDLLRTRLWGCPTFVLHPKLQDGKKLPKFKLRGRMGQFLGFSEEHSKSVAMIRNLTTNFVSPQWHVVYDELFSTIRNDTRLKDTAVESIFNDLFDNCREYYGDEAVCPPEGATGDGDAPASDETFDDPPLELGGEWLTEPACCEKKTCLEEWRLKQHGIWRRQAKEF